MRAVVYIITAILLSVLQTTFFGHAEIFGARPGLLLALVVCVALLRGSVDGGGVGLFCGLVTDIIGCGTFGVHSLMFMYTGVLAGLFSSKFYRVRGIVAFCFSLAFSLINGFLYYFFAHFIWGRTQMWFALSRKIFPESIYTAFAAIPILLIIRWANRRYGAREV
ncbi:MAG: rod shape-determining protein MreD [Firmicutes bacterium ADurb.Bin193]|nr:MAG: rod shape-determining protein MreD [Firmicutes bacterium ADurb.Bin193]